jgi:eukaryotic-like serine/threonine-protein kinase
MITAGTRLGPYEIVAPLGAGGMGEVYRARDTRLDRTVAIKILPPHLSGDPTLRQRFEREAKAISSLNHPHICVLYDVGNQDGTQFLVMECVEGETLAKRLEKGPLPLEQVLKYGTQIADALDKAHRSGVLHRDLKPGNIMLTASGAKLLDFGLAKAALPLAAGATLTGAATRTTPVTQRGTVVGTFQYMSPEQVEGKDVDARTDIFSFGSVLYEMVTGLRAFPGKSQLSVASAILEKEPTPITSVKPLTPPALDHAIRRCLAKDPEERWQTAHDVKLQLQWIAEEGSQAAIPAPLVLQRKARERLAWTAAALFVLTTTALAIGLALRAPKPPQPLRLSAEIGVDANLYTAEHGSAAVLSPDGTRLALVATGADQKRRIYIRPLDQLQATALSGTENAQEPFFSPDSQWLGFFADGKLKKVAIQGGAPVALCDVPSGRGGSWSEDGTIAFAPDIRTALLQVPANGGTPQQLTTLDKQSGEVTQRWPQFLPGGKAVLFTSNTHGGTYEDADIVAYSMASQQRKVVQQGGFYGRYVPTGHVMYMHEGTLFAVPFDVNRLEVTGAPAPVLEDIAAKPTDAAAHFTFSQAGSFAYIPGRGAMQNVSVYWMDRTGRFTPLRATPGEYVRPAFSSDGKRLALQIIAGKRSDIWVYEWERDTLTRLTFGGDANISPVWTPDGQRITYSSLERKGEYELYWKRADGAGDALPLTQSKTPKVNLSWRPDGKVLAFEQASPGGHWNIMTMTMEGDEKSGWKPGEPKPFLNNNNAFDIASPTFSPDGRWLAYDSFESGRNEIYVTPFPGPGGKWLVSTGTGFFPKWSRNGKELFYRTLENTIMVVDYTASADVFRPDKPRLWSPGQFTEVAGNLNFDLHPDGQRFAVLKVPAAAEAAPVNKVTFIFNFFDELRRKVPGGRN